TRFVLTDGDGGTSTPATRTVTVAATNSAPVIAAIEGTSLAYTENAAATPITATGTVTDADSADFATGTLTVDYTANGAAEDRLAVRNQGTGAGQIGVSGANVSYAGTTIGTFTGGTGTTGLVITLNASATPAAAQALVRNITYANVSNTPSTLTRTVRFVLTDGDGGTSAPATRTITVAAVDDAPVLAASGGTTPYTEQSAAVAVDAGLTVTDVEGGPNATGAAVTITSPVAGDLLHFTTQNGITGNFASGVLTLSGSATLANYQAALRSVQFSNPSSDAPGTSRSVGFQIVGPTASNTTTKTLAITQVNDPPVVFLDMAGPLAYTEQAGFVNLFGPASTVTDPDNATLSSLKVTVSAGFDATFDSLRLDPAVAGFTSNFSAGVLTLTRAGGTVAQFQTALRGVQFSNSSNDPDHRNDGTANPADADRSFTVVVDDGAGGTTPPLPRLLSITPVNDAPGAPGTLPTTTGIRNTTLVAGGAVATGPHVTRTVNLIGTATDPDGLESAITVTPAAAAATAQGGRMTLAANGDLRYEPPASATLPSDTYGYTLTDGTTASAPITWTVNLSGAVWYVADQAAGTQDGTAARPFATIAGATAVAGASQTIYVRRAPGDGILTAGVTLQSGQKLIGEGVALTNTDVGSATVETLAPAGTKPVLTASNADVLTLAANTQVAGVSIDPSGTGGGLFGNAVAGVTLRSMDVTDTGTAATQPGIELTGAGNGLTFTAPVSLSTTQAGALNLTGAALSGTLASTTVSGSTTSPGVSLTSTTGSLTFTTTAITTTNQPGFVLSNATGIDVLAGSVASTNRAAVDATGLGAGSDLTFTDVDSTTSTGDGVNLDGTDTAWTFSAGSGSTISGAAGIGFDLNNGTGVVTYAGTVGAGAAGKAIDVSSRTANATFSGNITGAGTAGGISVSGNTAGTTTFSGATKTLSTGTGAAVSLTGNAGATIAFSNGGLALTSTSGGGFLASGGGTVTVAGTGNTISTTTGTGLSIAATTIGAANATFQSISSNGAPSGIVLNGTGSTGTFSVTGTAAADSGGTIQNTTGPGVSLTNADAISLNRIKLLGTDRSGIKGTGVTGFSLTNSTVTGAGDAAIDDNDSSIAFNDTAGGLTNNVDGVVTITGNTLSNAYGAGISIFQYNGTISDAVITGNTVTSTLSTTTSRGAGIALNLFGSTTTVANLTKATISNNVISGFPAGDALAVQGANTASSAAPAGTYGVPGTANVVTMSGNQINGDATTKFNGFGITASVTGRGQGNFAITNNGTAGSPIRNMKGAAIGIGAAGDVTASFVVTGNQINANNQFGSDGIGLGTDKNIQADSSTLTHPNVRATITGNTVANTSGTGIGVLHRDSNGSLNVRIDNNTVGAPLQASPGISINAGSSGNATYNPTVCASVSGNNPTAGPPDTFGDTHPGIELFKRSSSSTTYVLGLTGLAPSPATNAQVESYVTGLNPTSSLGGGFYAGKRVAVRTGSNITSCTLAAGV
ncbi:right-handed parallel beta-helix repeat-containing protein, partial [Nocardioides marmoriginsengisoli]